MTEKEDFGRELMLEFLNRNFAITPRGTGMIRRRDAVVSKWIRGVKMRYGSDVANGAKWQYDSDKEGEQ